MHKAIQLRVTVWIEGEDQPAHNFFDSTKQAINDIIAAGKGRYPQLKVTIKEVAEDDDYDK
jgi:hypothetical protein